VLFDSEAGQEAIVEAHRTEQCRIALLTPYNGGNFGDAAIQDSVIMNLRRRLPRARFAGICLNLDNFIERHDKAAFPLCGVHLPFYHMLHGRVGQQPKYGIHVQSENSGRELKSSLKRTLKGIRPVWAVLSGLRGCYREGLHWLQGYLLLFPGEGSSTRNGVDLGASRMLFSSGQSLPGWRVCLT
jgi:hypothetical protein